MVGDNAALFSYSQLGCNEFMEFIQNLLIFLVPNDYFTT